MTQEKRFADKRSLKSWATKSAGIVLTSVTLMSSAQNLELQFSSPKALSTVMEGAPEYFPNGEYLVTYKNSDDIDPDDLDYSRMAMAISLEARLANSPTLVGGLQPLLRALGEFEYCFSINRTNPAYVTAGIWVVEPSDPQELEKLKSALHENAVLYALNDGAGFVTLNNARMGNGIQKTVRI